MTRVSSPVALKPEELDIVSAGDGSLINVSDNNVAVPVNAAVAVAAIGSEADATAVQKSFILQV
jgi:hypothetical protein